MKIEFTSNEEASAKFFPPLPAKKFIPDWYKSLDVYQPGMQDVFLDARKKINEELDSPFTIKACIPVQDFITSGYVLRMGSDLLLTANESRDHFWWFSPNLKANQTPNHHPHRQCPIKIEGENKVYFKIQHSWTVKTPPGYSCLFYQPFYNFEERFTLFPAIVDTDKHDNPVFFPGYFKTTDPIKLNAGDPLMVVLPFKRDEWQIDVKFKKQENSVIYSIMERAYQKLFHSPKKFN